MVKFYAACIGGVLAMSLTVQWGGLAAVAAANMQKPAVALSAAYAQADNQQEPLKHQLARVEQRYKIRINYVGNTVNGLYTDALPAKDPGVPMIDYLNDFLRSLGLEAEQAGKDQYIIFKKGKAKPASQPDKQATGLEMDPLNTSVAGTQQAAAL